MKKIFMTKSVKHFVQVRRSIIEHVMLSYFNLFFVFVSFLTSGTHFSFIKLEILKKEDEKKGGKFNKFYS